MHQQATLNMFENTGFFLKKDRMYQQINRNSQRKDMKNQIDNLDIENIIPVNIKSVDGFESRM